LPDESPQRWRCPVCLSYLPMEVDARGMRLPCVNCGYADAPPQADATSYGMMLTYDPPRTLDRVCALRQEPHRVTDHEAVHARLVPLPPPRTTQAARRDMMGAVVRLQAERGWRPAREAPLRTMAIEPCSRCGKPDRRACPCPPPAPRTLEAAIEHRRREVERRETAFDNAGYARLIERKG